MVGEAGGFGAVEVVEAVPSPHVTGAERRGVRRRWFVNSWSWEPVTVPTPVNGVSVRSGRCIHESGSVDLVAWDVDTLAGT